MKKIIKVMSVFLLALFFGLLTKVSGETYNVNDEINLPIQINGKLRANIMIEVDEDETQIKEKVHKAIENKLEGKTIVKEIYVKNRIYNVVVK